MTLTKFLMAIIFLINWITDICHRKQHLVKCYTIIFVNSSDNELNMREKNNSISIDEKNLLSRGD